MLSLIGSIYGKIAEIRNRLYDRDVFDTFELGARTISIGNLTTGGTGKTPLVAYVAAILAGRSEKVCILTRGYGRKNPKQRVLVSDGKQILADHHDSGDEPIELAQKLLGKAIVIADADRVAAAEWAKRKFGVTAFVLDDGFQHRKVRRDVDIVCIDAMDPFGGGETLPAGRLREPIENLARANAIVITRADLVGDISNLKSKIAKWNSSAAILEAENVISGILPIEEFHAKTQKTQSKKITDRAYAFCGLGNPESFYELLRRENVDIAGSKTFADHFVYTQKGVDELCADAKLHGAEVLLTTAKDAVKISNLKFEIPCFVVEIEMKIDDKDAFKEILI